MSQETVGTEKGLPTQNKGAHEEWVRARNDPTRGTGQKKKGCEPPTNPVKGSHPFFYKVCSAVSYSPTPYRVQYHRR